MANSGTDRLFYEEMANNSYFQEISVRLQVINKEIIRLIEAKKRYETELKKIIDELENTNTTK